MNREWLTAPLYRCLVPFTAIAEPVRDSTWFAVPRVEVTCFAGVWRPWEGERLADQLGQKRRELTQRSWELFAFLTTEENDLVRPVHDKAIPVILIEPEDHAEWLAGGDASFKLRRPLENSFIEVSSQQTYQDT